MTREEAIEVIEQDIPCEHDKDLIEALEMAISALSESDSDNKGEWIVVPDSYHEDGTIYESHWECSKCGSGRSGWGEFKFCPDCGADMRGGNK